MDSAADRIKSAGNVGVVRSKSSGNVGFVKSLFMAGVDSAADALALLPAPEHLTVQSRQRDGGPFRELSTPKHEL